MNKKMYTQKKKRFRSDFIGALYNASVAVLQNLPYHSFCSRHAGFAEWEQKLQITGLLW